MARKPGFMEWRARRARELREKLFAELGRLCVGCGAGDKLEFDLRVPGGDRHHRMNPYDRVLFYLREHAAGNVQVLCTSCNASKADGELQLRMSDENPF